MASILKWVILISGMLLLFTSVIGFVFSLLYLDRSEGWSIFVVALALPFLLVSLCMVTGILLAPKKPTVGAVFLAAAGIGCLIMAVVGLQVGVIGTLTYLLAAVVLFVGAYLAFKRAYVGS
jgi:hypothetical protein